MPRTKLGKQSQLEAILTPTQGQEILAILKTLCERVEHLEQSQIALSEQIGQQSSLFRQLLRELEPSENAEILQQLQTLCTALEQSASSLSDRRQ